MKLRNSTKRRLVFKVDSKTALMSDSDSDKGEADESCRKKTRQKLVSKNSTLSPLTNTSPSGRQSDPFAKLFQDSKDDSSRTEDQIESPFSSRSFYKSPSPLNIFKLKSLPNVLSPALAEKKPNSEITKTYGRNKKKKKKQDGKPILKGALSKSAGFSSFSKKSILDGLSTDFLKSDCDENATSQGSTSVAKNRKFFKTSASEKQERKLTTTLFDYRKVPAASLLHEPKKPKDSCFKLPTSASACLRKASIQSKSSLSQKEYGNENSFDDSFLNDMETEPVKASKKSGDKKLLHVASQIFGEDVDSNDLEQSNNCDFMSLVSSPIASAKGEHLADTSFCESLLSSEETATENEATLNTSTISKSKWPINSSKESVVTTSSTSKRNFYRNDRNSERKDLDQMVLDAGQKEIGAITCNQCEMLYDVNSEQDKREHYKFHNRTLNRLKFNGWKKERVIRHYIDGRVIVIIPEDPEYAHKKFAEVKSVMDSNLGFHNNSQSNLSAMQVYFYISESEKAVIGCVVAEPITKAYSVVAGSTPFSCIPDPIPCVCGINRIWTSAAHRRNHIASRMVNCLRSSFYYGVLLSLDQIAFSDPTPDGRKFAAAYTNRENFLVYNT